MTQYNPNQYRALGVGTKILASHYRLCNDGQAFPVESEWVDTIILEDCPHTFLEKLYYRVPPKTVPADAQARKNLPLCTGVLDYFPDALLAVAKCSKAGQLQHNPGQPLFWDRSKSTDEADALVRHLLSRGTTDTDGIRHSAKVAWRALAMLQKEIETDAGMTEATT